ncbi:acyl-CoA dehydrogenase family protein [Catenuloplanes indicus]|uniref:Acyl-[acyl-carrier-protein] dehydrogenase MbtN n=1 Tax=Catenuloplanes indicus TaxID=137267 RepID=A0AAE3VW45_9ACTN|nr:acyl-CoA dehydrogenase family protein [Catenuloplanes indicus]MDQ0364911.1 citronellyl-CoA dehydrogenase [Catenuloplanes indicus]
MTAVLPSPAHTGRLAVLPADADSRQIWSALAADGLLREAYRDGDPGAGVRPDGLRTVLTVVDERFSLGATLGVCVSVASAVPLLAGADGGHPAEVLARTLAGAGPIALAATDETAGTDLAALATEVSIDGDSIRVTGIKRWIANATHADHVLVLARHRPGRHFTSFTWVLVPVGAPGVTVTAADTDLFDGSGTGHVRLDDVHLHRSYLAGRPGRGMSGFAAHIAVERLAGGLWAVALCRRVLRRTRARLTAARPGGDTLWQSDTVRQRFAACLVRARQLDALTRAAGDDIVARRDTVSAALVKSAAATTVEHVLRECAQFHGADGFTRGGLQTLRAQAALFGIGGGADEVVLSIVAESADRVLAEMGVR